VWSAERLLVHPLVQGSIWLSMVCLPAGLLGHLLRRGGAASRWQWLARALWTLGAAAFVVHWLSAFHFEYRWSHEVALSETARLTAELSGRPSLTGWRAGWGLYLNYLFGLLWCADAWWWWMQPTTHARSVRRVLALHGFFLFMLVNGAVVFASGAVRWLGAGVSLMMLGMMVALATRWHEIREGVR
jgi:hypothetical protein